MKKASFWIVIFILLALDFAALDDITTGNENDFTLEYAILGVSVVVFLAVFLRRKVLQSFLGSGKSKR